MHLVPGAKNVRARSQSRRPSDGQPERARTDDHNYQGNKDADNNRGDTPQRRSGAYPPRGIQDDEKETEVIAMPPRHGR